MNRLQSPPASRAWAAWGEGSEIYEPCVVLKPEMVSVGDGCRIDSFVKIEGGRGVTLGRWVHIGSFSHVNIGGGTVIVGDGVAIASGAKVFGGSNTKQGCYMSHCAPSHLTHVDRAITVIEEGAFVGANAVVLPGLRVGRFAIVGAGAVVTHDVPEYEIWAGVPAKKIGERER